MNPLEWLNSWLIWSPLQILIVCWMASLVAILFFLPRMPRRKDPKVKEAIDSVRGALENGVNTRKVRAGS